MLQRSKIQWLETLYPNLSPEDALAQAFADGKFIAAEGDTVAGLFAPIEHTATLEKIASFKIRNRDKGFIVLSPSLDAIAPYIDFTRFQFEEWITLNSGGLGELGTEITNRAKATGKVAPSNFDQDVWRGKSRARAESDLIGKTFKLLTKLTIEMAIGRVGFDLFTKYLAQVFEVDATKKKDGVNNLEEDGVNNLFWGLLEFAPYYVEEKVATRLDQLFKDAYNNSRVLRKGTKNAYTDHVQYRREQLAQEPQFRSSILEVILNYFNGTQQKHHEIKLHPIDFTPYLKPVQEYVFAHNDRLDNIAKCSSTLHAICDHELLKNWGMEAEQEINFELWNRLLNCKHTQLFTVVLKIWFNYPANSVTQINSLQDLYLFLDWLLIGAHAVRAKIYGLLDNLRLLKAQASSKHPVSLYKTMSNVTLFGVCLFRTDKEAFTDHGITYIFPANLEKCPSQLIGEHDSIAVRFVAQQGYNNFPATQIGSRDTVVLNYVRKYQQPVVTTSVNLSGDKSITISLEENLTRLLKGQEVAQEMQFNPAYLSTDIFQEAWINAFKANKSSVTPQEWTQIFTNDFIATQTDLDNVKLHEQGHWIDPSPILHLRKGFLRNSARLSAAYKYVDIYNSNRHVYDCFMECFFIYCTNLVEWPKRFDGYTKDVYRDAC